MSLLWRLFSLARSATSWRGSVANARGTVQQLRDTAEQFQTNLFQRVRERAAGGDAQAQYELGEYYYYGRVVPADFQEALLWFLRAAQQSHAKAQTNAGFMLALGRGAAPDPVEGYKWLLLAAAQNEPSAKKALPTAAARLSPEQRATAEQRVASHGVGPDRNR